MSTTRMIEQAAPHRCNLDGSLRPLTDRELAIGLAQKHLGAPAPIGLPPVPGEEHGD